MKRAAGTMAACVIAGTCILWYYWAIRVPLAALPTPAGPQGIIDQSGDRIVSAIMSYKKLVGSYPRDLRALQLPANLTERWVYLYTDPHPTLHISIDWEESLSYDFAQVASEWKYTHGQATAFLHSNAPVQGP